MRRFWGTWRSSYQSTSQVYRQSYLPLDCHRTTFKCTRAATEHCQKIVLSAYDVHFFLETPTATMQRVKITNAATPADFVKKRAFRLVYGGILLYVT